MAVDMFLKMDPIKGESLDDKHKNELQVLAWSWGVSNSGSSHVGSGGGSGRANVQDLSFTKYIDSASVDLIQSCCSGKHFANAVLVVRKAGGDSPVEYVILTMEEIIISSVSTGGSGGEDRLTENVTLNFARVKFKYTPQSGTGTGSGGDEKGWDIQANKAI